MWKKVFNELAILIDVLDLNDSRAFAGRRGIAILWLVANLDIDDVSESRCHSWCPKNADGRASARPPQFTYAAFDVLSSRSVAPINALAYPSPATSTNDLVM